MLEEMIAMLENVLIQDQLFALGAKVLRKSVDALESEGFSREEAIRIVAAQGAMVKGGR